MNYSYLPPSPSQKGQIDCCMMPPLRPITTPILNVTNLVLQPSGSLALFSQSLHSRVSTLAELGGESSVYSTVSLGGQKPKEEIMYEEFMAGYLGRHATFINQFCVTSRNALQWLRSHHRGVTLPTFKETTGTVYEIGVHSSRFQEFSQLGATTRHSFINANIALRATQQLSRVSEQQMRCLTQCLFIWRKVVPCRRVIVSPEPSFTECSYETPC